MPHSPSETIRFLTLDELGRLLAAARASARNRALFLVAYRHGLRASEVGLLRAEDLDLRTLRLTVHRLNANQAVTVELTVTDNCGDWPTFFGGGPDAF